MTTIEEKLEEHKQFKNRVQTPSDLEDRLRLALHKAPNKKRRLNRAFIAVASAAAVFILVIGAYQYPAFAYYGGKLFNKIELSSLSFSEVAEQGYGQAVNKSKTLEDGTVITISGVIADDNAFLMYYSIDRETGSVFNEDSSYRYIVENINGFMTDSDPQEGNGNYSKDESHYEGVYRFEPVSPFSRTLTVTFSETLSNGERAAYPISFNFEANKAMKSIIKQDISKSVAVDQGTVYYDSITASPTSTIVRGHYEMEDEMYPRFLGATSLYVNGTEVKAWGIESDHSGGAGIAGFKLEYDVLPTDKLETIELVLDNFSGYQKVEQPISLASPSDQSIPLGNEKLWIRSVSQTDTGYNIVVARKQFTILESDKLSVQANGNIVPVASISSSRPWELDNGNTLWEQTYSFNTKDKPEFLLLDGFYYIKAYNKTISIPVGIDK